MEPYIGEIKLFVGKFEPKGWAFCDGRLLNIRDNAPLYSILQNRFGGDGKSTFALPDLRGRVPIHKGQVSGLSERRLGETGGVAQVSLDVEQLPRHSHKAMGALIIASAAAPASPLGAIWAATKTIGTVKPYAAPNVPPNAVMSGDALASAGGGGAHNNMQPFLVLNYVVALQGIFPVKAK